MNPVGQRKCLHCKQFFVPDARQRKRQCYCAKPECRRESKAASQRRWLARPENRDYFRGLANVQRVQEWRAANPTRKRPARRKQEATVAAQEVLQDLKNAQQSPPQSPTPPDGAAVLQETWKAQPPLLLGLIAHLTGTALQEDMERMTRRLITRGRALLEPFPQRELNPTHDRKTPPLSGTRAASAAAF